MSATTPGQPKQEMVDPSGTYSLKATAAPSSSTAAARLESGAPKSLAAGTSATAAVVAENDSVVATASSLTEGLTLGDGILSLGSLASRSVTKLSAGHEPVTETELTVSALRVGDKRIGVGPAGFELLGTPVPLPSADVAKLIAATLAPAGLQLRFIAPETIAGGARAAALEIVSHQAPPNIPASDMTIRLGGATSAITFGEGTVQLPDTGSLPTDSPPAGPEPTGAPASSTAIDVPAPLPTTPVSAPTGLTLPVVGASSFASPASGAAGAAIADPAAVPAADQAAAPAALPAGGGTTLDAAPIFSPRRASALGLLYAIAAALGLSAVVGAGAWAIRGRWSA